MLYVITSHFSTTSKYVPYDCPRQESFSGILNKSNNKSHNCDHEEGPYPEETSQSKFLAAFCGFCPVHEYKLMLIHRDSDLLLIILCRDWNSISKI